MSGFKGPNGSIVTEGLVYYIDNPNKKSYVSGSTTINNLVGTDVSSLPNGIGLTPEYKGGWALDGVDDYILTDQIDSQQLTVDIWFEFTEPFSSSDYYCMFRMGRDPVPYSLNFGSPVLNPYIGYRLRPISFFRNSTCPTSSAKTFSLNIDTNFLYNLIITFDWTTTTATCYLSDSLAGTDATTKTGPISATITDFSTCSIYQFNNTSQLYNPMDIGRLITFGYYLPGNIYNFKMYNRVLNESERNRNYNALKSRFGL